MSKNVYPTLAKLFGLVAGGVGVGALAGGIFARSFVGRQLGSEGITMPDEATIERELKIGLISEEDAKQLTKHAGQRLNSGPHARGYADNYILPHMHFAAAKSGVPAEKATFAGVGDIIKDKTNKLRAEIRAEEGNEDKTPAEIAAMAKMEIGDPETDFLTAREIADLNALRADNFFLGNALRGMLLNAYAWWLVGFVATIAGYVLSGVGAVLALGGWLGGRKRK